MSLTNIELGQFLRTIRESLGYSTYNVNKLCNISPSYLSLLETGKRKPSAIILKKLAPIYNLNYIDLYEKAGYIDLIEIQNAIYKSNKLNKLENAVSKVPLLSTLKVGDDYMSQKNWECMIEVDRNIIKDGSDYFALKIKGDSMSPILIEDDIVIIKKQEDFENGNLVVTSVNGDEATIKKGKKNDNSILLQPLNTNYEPLIFTYPEMETIPITIFGIVKQLKREF